jgi:hypothetical protein
MRLLPKLAAAILCGPLLPSLCPGQSLYGISIDTSRAQGLGGKLVFDITSNTPLTNRFDIINFKTDGLTATPETQGYFILGDLIQDVRTAPFTRVYGDDFFMELSVPFVAFGKLTTFTVNVSETRPFRHRPPDEFSLYVLDENGNSLGTTDGGGSTPNLSVTITGRRGGTPQISQEHSDEQRSESRPYVHVSVTPLWTPENPSFWNNARQFEGTLTEFCNRRCAGTTSCTGGAYGIKIDENTFYSFDDVGGLKAQVALVKKGINPLREGSFVHAKVIGVLNKTTLTVREVKID